jgi:chromosome segregation protein
MDTGLGRDAYSIIGQGRIEEILSTRPEERRGVFEEAAGVVKYKNRKKEAEKKLEETSANLVRIQDIVLEVENQLGPLKEQADQAKRYKALKEELTSKEISSCAYMIDRLHSQWQEAQEQLKKLKIEEQEKIAQINQAEAHSEQVKWALSQLENSLEKKQEQLLRITEELERMESQREVLREREKNFSVNHANIQSNIEQLTDRYHQSDQEWEMEQKRLKTIQESLNQLRKEIKEIEDKTADFNSEIDEKIEQLKGDYIEALNKQAALRNEERHLKLRIEQEKQRLNRLMEEREKNRQELEILTKQHEERKQFLEATQSQLSDQHEAISKLGETRKSLLDQLSGLEHTYRNHLAQIEQLAGRYRVLKELKEEYSGYAQGVKEVLKAKKRQLEGIHGAIGELIKVSPKYEIAIETALGSAMQYIVVRDEQAARDAIAYLKKHQSGRATFLPKNILKSRVIPTKERAIIEQAEGLIGLAHELVEVDDQFRIVLEYLLGNVIVMEKLNWANILARTLGYRYRLVTLDGDVVHPGGLMTGGGVKRNKASLLSRDRELAELEHRLATLKQENNKLKQQMEQTRSSLGKIDQAMELGKHEIGELREKEQMEKEHLSQIHYQIKRLDEKRELIDQDVHDCEHQIQHFNSSLEQLRAGFSQITAQSNAIETEIKQLEQMKKQQEENKAEAGEQLTQLKVALAAKKQEYDSLELHVKRLALSRKQMEEEIYLLRNQLEKLKNDLLAQQSQQRELEAAIRDKKEERERLNDSIINARQERRQMQHDLEKLEIQIKEMRLSLKETQGTIHELEVKIGKLDVELERYLTLLREEYQISYEWAKERYPLKEPFEITRERVEQLKKEISRLGPVNLAAIEQYEQLKERYTFLKGQEEDLKQAKLTLDRVIREMDEEMSLRFKNTFEQIREHFSKIFKELFGGGKADLYLSDPSNLLTTGVEIVAQPPGKKLQYLSLLSGGERALTAIALLFAILEVKPVPFCVLDEVEAALDEANVYRFARYLKNRVDKTQFIVITHRKGTMEEADVLYGVTMPEAGVSKLVSVKLLAS